MTALLTHSARAITDGWMAFLRILSANYGIKFVIGENVPPKTDGKTCWLPALPFELTKDDLTLFQSNGYHEIGHVMHSDIPFFQRFAKKHGQFAGFLLNAVDDVWMENKQAATVRRSTICFRKSIDLLFERKQFRDGSASVAEAVGCYTLCFLGVQYWSEYVRPLEVVTANFDSHFGEHATFVRQQLDELLLAEFPRVQSTVDGGALTLRIIELLKMLGEEDEQKRASQPEEGKPNNSPEPQPRPDGSAGDSKNATANGQTPEQSGGTPDGGGAAQGDNCASGKGLGQDEKKQADGSRQTLSQIVEQILATADLGDREVFDFQAAVQEISASVESGENPDYKDVSNVPKCVIDGNVVPAPRKPGDAPKKGAGSGWGVDGIAFCPSDPAEAKRMAEQMGRKPQILANRLEALLMQHEEAEAFASMRGNLGEANLHRLVLGDPRIFVQHNEVERPTTAVSLVADLSRSTMDVADLKHATGEESIPTDGVAPSRLRSIIESAVLLEKVLDRIGVPREIFGFAPRMGVLMSAVRSFGDDHQTALARLGGLRRVAGGGQTPIAEAVFHAGRRLAAHSANRKVMFVLTDGVPSNEEKAVEMTKYFERYGVRIVYLVIGNLSATAWLAKARIPFAQARTCDEICPALMNKAATLLS